MNIEISAALPTNHQFDNAVDALKFTLRSIVSLAKQNHIQANHKFHIDDAGSGMWNIWFDDLVGNGATFLQVYEEGIGFDDVCFLCIDGSDNCIPIYSLPEMFIYYIIKQIIRESNLWINMGDTLKLH